RGRYYAEHFRRRGPLLKRLGKVLGSPPQFIKQPRVLDGDDGLRGEALYQLDLLIGEGLYLLPINGDGPGYFAVFEHRNHEEGPCSSKFGKSDRRRMTLFLINRLFRIIGDVDYISGGNCTP